MAAHYVESSLPQSASHPPVSRFLQMFRAQMQRVRSVRYDTTRRAAAADARKWTRGSDAFHTALELFQQAVERLGRPSTTALDQLLAFSLQLNASSASHKRRGDFVGTLATVFWRNNDYDRGVALLGNQQVVDFVVDFLLYGDSDALVDRVVTTRWAV